MRRVIALLLTLSSLGFFIDREAASPDPVLSWIGGNVPRLISNDDAEAGGRGVSAKVVRVVDGDTFHALVHGRDLTIRAFGIDTPETVKPNTPVRCGGPEASALARRLLTSSERIHLAPEPGGDRIDQYGRALRWITLSDGSSFQRRMVRAGWADVYRFNGRRFSKDAALSADRAAARDADRGVFGRCGGRFH